jgi:hypothetical protein
MNPDLAAQPTLLRGDRHTHRSVGVGTSFRTARRRPYGSADIPHMSALDRRCLAAWRQYWQQRHGGRA